METSKVKILNGELPLGCKSGMITPIDIACIHYAMHSERAVDRVMRNLVLNS